MTLNPEKYRVSPQLLDEMRENDYKLKHKQFANYYDEWNIKSPDEITHEKLENIYNILSDPLKKMHSLYLTRSAKNCYQDKHLQDDWTNLEQIKLCREMTRDKIFGDFEELLRSQRIKDAYNLQQCLKEARNQKTKHLE